MSKLIPVWDVQTFYGTKAKTFHRPHHAEDYIRQLEDDYPELIEVSKRFLTEEEFCYEKLDD